MLNKATVEKKWYIIDAEGKALGRVAAGAIAIEFLKQLGIEICAYFIKKNRPSRACARTGRLSLWDLLRECLCFWGLLAFFLLAVRA